MFAWNSAISILILLFVSCEGFHSELASQRMKIHQTQSRNIQSINNYSAHIQRLQAVSSSSEKGKEEEEDLDETTKKYGLEVGLYKSVTNKNEKNKIKPKDLLAKYGIAYLVTSISLAAVSYAICYVLVSNGIDVSGLLEKIGIQASTTASSAGTAGIAYAIHKAASPIRFPPTVALTPVVANWMGKSPSEEKKEN